MASVTNEQVHSKLFHEDGPQGCPNSGKGAGIAPRIPIIGA
jgi:hypothetical protein